MHLFVLLSCCIFILANTMAKTSDHNVQFPSFWREAPSSLNDYPLSNDSSESRLIDPWFYPHRLGLYKIIIDVTSPLMPFCSLSSTNVHNILFGPASQFGWQFDSNRLFTNDTMEISTNSWWASANYYISVIPFIAAVDVGLIQQGPFRIIKRENFCSNFDRRITISYCNCSPP